MNELNNLIVTNIEEPDWKSEQSIRIKDPFRGDEYSHGKRADQFQRTERNAGRDRRQPGFAPGEPRRQCLHQSA